MEKSINEILLNIQTKLVAPKNQFNAFGKYKYRSCEDILEALKPLLKEFGASVRISDDVVLIGDRFYVKATASICVGTNCISVSAFAREGFDKKGMDEAQITGAASSYARKYALNGLFLIDDTKDADHDNTHALAQPAVKNNVNTQEGLKKTLQQKVVVPSTIKTALPVSAHAKDPVSIYDKVTKASNKVESLGLTDTLSELEAFVMNVEFNPTIGKSGMSRVQVRDKEGFEFYVKKWGKVSEELLNKEVLLLLIKVSEFKGKREYTADKIVPVELVAVEPEPEEIVWEE